MPEGKIALSPAGSCEERGADGLRNFHEQGQHEQYGHDGGDEDERCVGRFAVDLLNERFIIVDEAVDQRHVTAVGSMEEVDDVADIEGDKA